MEITLTTLILVGAVCVILGFLASVLWNTLSEGSDAPVEATDEAPPGGKKGRYTPVFRIWREKTAGTLVVEIEGKAMIAPDPLTDVQRERLEQSVRDLRAWLGMGLPGTRVAPPKVDPQPVAVLREATQNPVEEIDLNRAFSSAPAEPAHRPVAPAPQPARPTVKPAAVPPPSTSPRSAAVQPPATKGKDEAAPVPPAKSIVLQIEDILQDMIAGTEMAERGIHLLEDPTRGVIVQVGLENFEGIDAVPYPQIKDVIQSAVQEWEKSQ
jgi:hypothetical protein